MFCFLCLAHDDTNAMDNNYIMETHLVGNQGGIRKSNRTKSFVLIMNYKVTKYDDKTNPSMFEFEYDGAFKSGENDQQMTHMNKALAETTWPLHVYDRAANTNRLVYRYVGVYERHGEPVNIMRNGRRVFVYTLRRITPTVTYDFETFEY